MRQEIYNNMEYYSKMNLKPNYSALAEQLNCDRRTIKRAHVATSTVNSISFNPSNKERSSKLDEFKTTIESKIELNCTATSIYYYIQGLGYKGKYTILRNFVHKVKTNRLKKATIRVETTPGLQGQVDWKESMKLTNRNGEVFIINLFLYVQCFSRYKIILLTVDRKQDTLFHCLMNTFQTLGGVPQEIWFDNMKTVVDHHHVRTNEIQFNQRFLIFAKDMGFKPIACKPYRPQTKGKVEALAKCTDTLKVFNNEFETIDDLHQIVQDYNNYLNNHISQATGFVAVHLLKKEKEYLLSLPSDEILESYLSTPIVRKVSNESLITYANNKYSVPTNYIGKTLELEVKHNMLYIYYTKKLVCMHQLGRKRFNYLPEHYQEIMKSNAFKYSSEQEIEEIAAKNLKVFDELL